ncbi:hypothetical protein K438DRAFT_1834407 [Mycena galopus ATCC 62051]|nr:hypothetical protein K438DRAFT_1834407 [Mycena galopus ATCC 62051]
MSPFDKTVHKSKTRASFIPASRIRSLLLAPASKLRATDGTLSANVVAESESPTGEAAIHTSSELKVCTIAVDTQTGSHAMTDKLSAATAVSAMSSSFATSKTTQFADTEQKEPVPRMRGQQSNLILELSPPSITPSNAFSTILAEDTPRSTNPGSRWKNLAWKAFKQALAVLKDASAAFPPLQSAVSALVRILAQIEEISDARDDLEMMGRRILALSTLLSQYQERTTDEDTQNRISGMTALIAQQARRIEAKLAPGVRNVIANSPVARDLLESMRAVSFFITLFQTDTALNNEAKAIEMKNLISQFHDFYVLEKLCPVPGSSFADVHSNGKCMPGTRVGVLTELMVWATERDSPGIYLLSGMAGAGKSAIARSFANVLDSQGLLGASFFCSRASEARSNVTGIIPSIAFRLAYHSHQFAEAVIRAIKLAPGISFSHCSPSIQFTNLIMHPLLTLPPTVLIPVVVIDALDECSGRNIVQELLALFVRSSPSLIGSRLKVLITSRPELHIERALNVDGVARHLRLRDIEDMIVSADVEKYLKKNLGDISRRIRSPEWPTTKSITDLVHRTGQLFIFAFTVVQYLSAETLSPKEIKTRLDNILSASFPTKIQTAAIDALYGQIINAAWEGKEPDEKLVRRHALATIITLREPLTLSAISGLLGEDPDDLEFILADFRSVLDIPSSSNAPVTIFHASFPDYMTDGRRSGDNALALEKHHAALALRCIELMNSLLHHNMCGITRSDSAASIAETVLRRSVPAHLRYASIHWGSHISSMIPGEVDPNLISELAAWTRTHVLHWLECLSVIGQMHLAPDTLQKAISFVSSHNFHEIDNVLDDVRRMLPQIFTFASIYPCEVYHSALEWLPIDCSLRKLYRRGSAPCVLAGVPQHWDKCERILGHGARCNCAAVSPDGAHVVSASSDNKAYIWSMNTGRMEHELVGHSDEVICVAYAPDGKRIASGSMDTTIRLWSVFTAETERSLVGHTQAVTAVAFSPDGSRLASGSHDTTIRVWNVELAANERELRVHSGPVYSIAFAFEGARILSSSEDGTIQISAADTGETQWTYSIKYCWTVVFSVDGRRMAAGAYDDGYIIRLWNARNRELEHALAGHTQPVRSIAFSPDGSRLVSGSLDRTIRIWNADSGQTEQRFSANPSMITSVSFSPDGTRVISAEDRAVRIWSGSVNEVTTPVGGSAWVWSVVFITPGDRIITRSCRNTVQIWNAVTGDLEKKFTETALAQSFPDLIPPYNPFERLESASVNCELGAAGDYLSLHSESDPHYKRLWIWSDYQQGIRSSAFQGTRACVGYNSGRVVIVDLSHL